MRIGRIPFRYRRILLRGFRSEVSREWRDERAATKSCFFAWRCGSNESLESRVRPRYLMVADSGIWMELMDIPALGSLRSEGRVEKWMTCDLGMLSRIFHRW